MYKIKDLTNYLEELAPLQYQESYDNAGLIVGDPNAEIKGVLLSLDSTERVVDEAIAVGANIIVAHHPIVFSGLKQLTGATYIERTVIKAIKNDIAIYAIHTNLDAVTGGVNSKICEKLNLINSCILSSKKDLPSVGLGMIGQLKTAMDEMTFLNKVKDEFKAGVVRHTDLLARRIKKVAVCGGSGSFLLNDAIAAGADVFVTSDFKYHQFFDAENKILIADIGHYEAEICTTELIYDYITKKFTTFDLHFSRENTNPIHYL